MPPFPLLLGTRTGLYLLVLTASVPVTAALAQNNDTVHTVVRRVSVTKQPIQKYESTDLSAIVDEHKTSIEVLSLFKPEEIIMKPVRSLQESPDHLTMQIDVKEKAHPVLTYFEQKAKLRYNGTLYHHNEIPDINPSKVASVTFEDFTGTMYEGLLENYLEVKLYGEEHMPSEKTVYSTEPKEIMLYDVDGTITDRTGLQKLKLKPGTFTRKTLFGQEAVKQYGDMKFADGVVIIRTNK
ncbi:hypothetical protein ACMA1I_04655 [Pontibacter sp. 13R65]|uniref:hypothetical protein n=1 Tax=Pontibacter sp. 13R65 TaxID=3127458 RepID=UPI00301B860B